MKNEIKEILGKLETVAGKHTIEIREDGSKIERMPAFVVNELRLNNFSAKLLLDYITNLQGRFDALLEAHKITDELETEFQERNEKAIEFIKTTPSIDGYISHNAMMYMLLNILQGDDKNVKDKK